MNFVLFFLVQCISTKLGLGCFLELMLFEIRIILVEVICWIDLGKDEF